jgi:hypothetical protein
MLNNICKSILLGFTLFVILYEVLHSQLNIWYFGIFIIGMIFSFHDILERFLQTLSKFTFKAFGIFNFEAITKQVKDAAAEVKISTDALRELSLTLAKNMLVLTNKTGRLNPSNNKEVDLLTTEISNALEKMGIKKEIIKNEIYPITQKYHKYDYVNGILRSQHSKLNDQIRQRNNPNLISECNAFARKHTLDFPMQPGDIETFLKKIEFWDNDVGELVKDYAYYIKKKEHRRPDVFYKLFNE